MESLVWSGRDFAGSKKLSRNQGISIQAGEGERKAIRQSGIEVGGTRQSRQALLKLSETLRGLPKSKVVQRASSKSRREESPLPCPL